ncbi:hypothetical protein ACFQNJ_16945 [Hydrogenophaga bisanensis]|uniref:Uncharacterized protein n=1 Tax=Hydrogenophaga bisanensis TaxID=439611 RepID=A0ABW2RDL6_9BURK
MPKAAAKDQVQDNTTALAAADAELNAADAAIAEASKYAEAAQATGEHGGEEAPLVRTELTPEERAAVSRQIAKRQRQMGTAELERLYPSAIVVNVDLKVNDPNIASSAARFLGLTDRTLYLINRFGSRFMTDSEVETTRASIRELIEQYALEARQSLEQGQLLVEKTRGNRDDWLTPSYTSSTLEAGFAVKARDTMTLVRALRQWDEAILQFASLEFNDGASLGQIDTMRVRERTLFMQVNRQCIRAVKAFNRRRAEAAQKRINKAKAEEQQVTATEPAEATA